MILSSRPLAGSLPPSRWAPSLVVSGVFLVSACVVVVPGADDFDYPAILAVDASCDDEGYFELWTEVDHEDGPRAVVWVWVEVSYVLYDDFDNIELDPWGSVDLEYIADGQWGLVLPPGDVLLDCEYPYEYHFGFFAEDEDGDVTSTDLIN